MNLVDRKMIAALLAGALLAAFTAAAPARADDDSVFGQPAPRQFLINKMVGPKSDAANSQAAGGNGQAAAGGNGQVAGANGQAVAAQAGDEEDDGPGPFPRRYLLNKMFDNFGK
jgi:hypothetical protein